MLQSFDFVPKIFRWFERVALSHAENRVRDEDLKFFRITQIAFLVGLIGHSLSIPSFADLGVTEMVWFNIGISVPFFAVAFIINRQGHHNLAFTLAFVELYCHQIVGTYFMGWGYGLQYWLIYLSGLCFFNPHWRSWVRYPMFVLVSGGLVGLFLYAQQGVYQLPPDALKSSTVSNLILPLAVLALLINYFSRSAHDAEEKLKKEKALTEQQNAQLSRQHEALAIEQNKTARMLDRIQSLFGQQVSQEVADELIKNSSAIDSKTYDLTIMFLDIRDFTVFADSREPAEVAKFQNIVFGELNEIVRQNHGIVLQILGDGIMAVYGAPVVTTDHASNAISAGYQMITRIKELGESGMIPVIRVGIGLNAGPVVAGNVGNESRRFYSLTGKNVIIAARIEQLNKEFKSQFLVSDSVYCSQNSTERQGESLGEIALKGIEKPVKVYKLA